MYIGGICHLLNVYTLFPFPVHSLFCFQFRQHLTFQRDPRKRNISMFVLVISLHVSIMVCQICTICCDCMNSEQWSLKLLEYLHTYVHIRTYLTTNVLLETVEYMHLYVVRTLTIHTCITQDLLYVCMYGSSFMHVVAGCSEQIHTYMYTHISLAHQEGDSNAGRSQGSHRGASECGPGGQFMLAASDYPGTVWEHLNKVRPSGDFCSRCASPLHIYPLHPCNIHIVAVESWVAR